MNNDYFFFAAGIVFVAGMVAGALINGLLWTADCDNLGAHLRGGTVYVCARK